MQKNIVYEDESILVVYKPAGIATQTARLGQQDMVSELKNYLAKKPENKGKGEPYLGLVHRLDQPVSGILVFARTPKAAAALSRQITDKSMRKFYYAVIFGSPKQDAGSLEDYLYKDGKTNQSLIVREGFPEAKKALLHYKKVKTLMVLEKQQEVSLMEIELITGRHHQIRVQMAHAGMPLLGDGKYGSRINGDVALCSFRLSFIHPLTKEKLCFSILPEMKQKWKLFEKELAFFGIES